MKIILRENVEKLGKAGSIVNVKPGFARNYLMPRQLGIPATAEHMKAFEHQKRILEVRAQKLRKGAEALKEKLEKFSCSISKKVGEQDKLFGSVTAQEIEQAFRAEGFEIERKDILLDEPIKALGVYTVPIRVFEEIIANTKVWVVRES